MEISLNGDYRRPRGRPPTVKIGVVREVDDGNVDTSDQEGQPEIAEPPAPVGRRGRPPTTGRPRVLPRNQVSTGTPSAEGGVFEPENYAVNTAVNTAPTTIRGHFQVPRGGAPFLLYTTREKNPSLFLQGISDLPEKRSRPPIEFLRSEYEGEHETKKARVTQVTPTAAGAGAAPHSSSSSSRAVLVKKAMGLLGLETQRGRPSAQRLALLLRCENAADAQISGDKRPLSVILRSTGDNEDEDEDEDEVEEEEEEEEEEERETTKPRGPGRGRWGPRKLKQEQERETTKPLGPGRGRWGPRKLKQEQEPVVTLAQDDSPLVQQAYSILGLQKSARGRPSLERKQLINRAKKAAKSKADGDRRPMKDILLDLASQVGGAKRPQSASVSASSSSSSSSKKRDFKAERQTLAKQIDLQQMRLIALLQEERASISQNNSPSPVFRTEGDHNDALRELEATYSRLDEAVSAAEVLFAQVRECEYRLRPGEVGNEPAAIFFAVSASSFPRDSKEWKVDEWSRTRLPRVSESLQKLFLAGYA